MNTIQLPNLNKETNSTIPTIINEKSYTFNYLWINDYAILDIYLNDVDINDCSIANVRNYISLMSQNDILYNDYFTATKRGVLDEINNKVVYQTFPEGKEKERRLGVMSERI